ncbi:hypothetical protein EVAR_50209_1 [Eumeta japonica]|uniref:Uncharacterized protein n=1 Tax=Eumeta variegata TaxID=151549 RepID=A0A4C1WY14_EUMVA|nr:hypothetical protein EVAR_50209_1 [Eumeta japonica]
MTASGGLWSVCENIIRESEEDDPLSTLSSSNSLKEEVEKYLRSPNIPRDAYPLLFWHNDNCNKEVSGRRRQSVRLEAPNQREDNHKIKEIAGPRAGAGPCLFSDRSRLAGKGRRR